MIPMGKIRILSRLGISSGDDEIIVAIYVVAVDGKTQNAGFL